MTYPSYPPQQPYQQPPAVASPYRPSYPAYPAYPAPPLTYTYHSPEEYQRHAAQLMAQGYTVTGMTGGDTHMSSLTILGVAAATFILGLIMCCLFLPIGLLVFALGALTCVIMLAVGRYDITVTYTPNPYATRPLY